MKHISIKIFGVPYGKDKTRGDIEATNRWMQSVIAQTSSLPKIKEACIAKVTFCLPKDKFPTDFPYDSDLDKLLKCSFDNKSVELICQNYLLL